MPDPLTLSVMSQIAKKAGGTGGKPETVNTVSDCSEIHVTERQAVLLSELIQKKKPGAVVSGTVGTVRRSNGAVSLEALVNSTKTR